METPLIEVKNLEKHLRHFPGAYSRRCVETPFPKFAQ